MREQLLAKLRAKVNFLTKNHEEAILDLLQAEISKAFEEGFNSGYEEGYDNADIDKDERIGN